MNPATFGRKPIGIPLVGAIAALALSLAACSPSGSDTDDDGVIQAAGSPGPDANLANPDQQVDNDDDGRDDDDADGKDDDDRALSASERQSAEKAALDAVGPGTVTGVEASDDPGVAYEVDVRTAQGVEWDVDLDAKFAVVSKTKEN